MKNRNLDHSDNWATPIALYNGLNEEFKFDFDPCPYREDEITEDTDGLLIEWGMNNYINPPYSRKLKEQFIKRSVEFKDKGRLCVMLLPVSTSTVIFHEVILPNATDIRFIKGRVKFDKISESGDRYSCGTGMHDSMVVVFDGRGRND